MFLLGDGPIKGFAVTLSIGLFSTIFSNIVFARVLTKYFVKSLPPMRGQNEV
jgi:preprotein translocase subunit SecD/SecD/SecF fusion protein